MSIKTRDNLGKIVLVLLIITAILTATLINLSGLVKGQAGYAEEVADTAGESTGVATTLVVTDSGKVSYQIPSQLEAENVGYVWVTTYNDLKNAINENANICLGADISYDVNPTNSSGNFAPNAFTGELNGNGHTITINADESSGSVSKPAASPVTVANDNYSTNYYAYSYFIPYNKGTIKNTNFVYESNHNLTAVSGLQPGTTEYHFKADSNTYKGPSAGGIITGINDGTISNISLDVRGQFAFGHNPNQDKKSTTILVSTVIAGGVAGATLGNSVIEYSSVNIGANPNGTIVGKHTIIYGNGEGRALAVAGGFVGNISQYKSGSASAKFTNNVLTGTGDVVAYTSGRQYSTHLFAGGYIASSFVLTGSQNYRTINLTTIENDAVNKQKNPIRGLISSWTGAAISRGIGTHDADVSRKAGLFDYVGDASVNIILAYDHATVTDETYIDNSRNAGWYDSTPIDGSTVSHIESWSEAYSTTASGKVYLAYEKTEDGKYTDYVKIGALADDADKNVPEIGQYLSEKGNRYIDMPLTASGHVINSNIQQAKMVYFAKVTANNSTTYDCHPGNFYGGFIKRIGQTWLNDVEYSIQFGEMLDYQVIDNDGIQITVGSEEYSGNPISSMPRAKFLSAYNSSVSGEVANSWRIMRTPYYMGNEVPEAKVVTALQNTYLTGEYSFYPIESAQFDRNDATIYYFAYLNTEKLLVSRLNVNNNYKHSINPVGINAQLQENGEWAKQATFNISLTTNSEFNAYRVYRGNGAGDIVKTNGRVTSTQFIDTTTTGANGAMYRFAVYMLMDDGEEVVLGQTQRGQTEITAKIDNENPVFRETNIYAYDETKEYKLGDPLDKNDWYNRKIVVEYIVDDDDRSGISNYSIPSTLQYSTELVDGNITRIFIYIDQTEEAVTISITDALGYTTTNTQGFNIDTVNLNITDVRTTAVLGEYEQNKKQTIRINIAEKLGSSGWKGYYQSATPGVALNDDAWIETDISVLNNGLYLNFDINFSLENKLIYFKFVNNEQLFKDVISEGIGPNPNDTGTGWTITLNYGTLNFKRSQVYINNTALTELSEEEIYNALKKSYDGSTQCNTGLFDFADTRDGGEVEFIENALEDKSYLSKSNFELIAEYGQSNAGITTVKLLICGVNQFKELFYVTIEGDEYITLNTEIEKLTINYDIEQDNMIVKYGDTVPMTKDITATVGEKEYTFTLKYSTDRTITDVGTYEYRVEVDDYDNFTINVTGGEYATITVEPKERMIYTLLDGVRNHGATMAFDQKEHSLKAYYLDLDGNIVECESRITGSPTGANNVLRIVGQYTFEFSIADKNYTISSDSGNSTSVFTILSATMPITTGIQEVQYDSLAQVFKPKVPDYALGKLEITYYPVTDVEVDAAGNIKGNVGQRIDPSKVTETGYYKVAVRYTLHETEKINYHECEIPDGWLVINKAPVEFQVQEKRVTYTGEKFTMELSEGSGSNIYYFARLFVTTANGDKVPYAHLNSSAIKDIKITSKVKGVGIGAEDTWEEGVYYNKAGEYEYKVSFEGTSNYTGAEAIVKLVIAPATFEGITFNSQSFDYEANIERSISVNIPDIYSQAKVSYSSQGTIGSSSTPIKRTNAGDYTITATVSMENYHNFVINAKMTINKAKFTNIYAESKEVIFDGNTHEVVLVGVEKYKNQGVPVIVTARDGTSALRAGTYIGAYLISATNYETLTIETSLIIKPKEVEVSYQSIIDKNIDSATDISELTVSYTDPISGEVRSAKIEIYDAEGNVVDTTVTKKLKAGEYTAKIKMPDSDYIASNQSASITFTVEKASNLLPILVIGGVAVVVIGLVVIIIVVASKKKGGKRRV